MTNRERFWAAVAGDRPDHIPFLPFAELMPPSPFVSALIEAGMGLIQHAASAFPELPSGMLTRLPEVDGVRYRYATPRAIVEERYRGTDMRISGSEDGAQVEYMIKTAADYPAARSVIDSTLYSSDIAAFLTQDTSLGDKGVTHTWTGEPPYMGAQYYLGLEKWSLDQHDFADEFEGLLESLRLRQERLMEVTLAGPETIINIGNLAGNFGPRDFQRQMLPYLREQSTRLRSAGKLSTLHADANNLSCFLDLIPQTGVDIVEAFTPPPFGDLELADARRAWGEEVLIWINVPEAIFYEGPQETRRYVTRLLASDPSPRKIIGLTEMGLLGVNSDTRSIFESGIEAILQAVLESSI